MKSKLLPEGRYKATFMGISRHPHNHTASWRIEGTDQYIFDGIFDQKKNNLYKKFSIKDTAILSIKQILLFDDRIINSIIYVYPEEKKMESKAAKDLVRLVRGIVQEELDMQRNPDEDDGDRAGLVWSKAEDRQLIEEVALAMHVIAVVHKRKYGGITSRIQQLMKNGKLRI